jgi:ABC-type Fe3+-hydroxamate transport system substrate-binding protein
MGGEIFGPAVEGLGVPVMYLSSETPEGFYADPERFGLIFQNEARAQEVIAYYQECVKRIEDATQGLTEEEKPSVLFIQYSTKGGEISYKVPPPAWMQTTMLQMAGERRSGWMPNSAPAGP